MMTIGPLGFATPWLLIAGLGLPALWMLLRAVPPRPKDIIFPGTSLLAGLSDPAPITARTPLWLLLLRVAAVAAAIIALAGPVWRPGPQLAGDGPLLVVVDAGWQAAPGWQDATQRARAAIEQAGSQGRPVALWIADGQGGRGNSPVFIEASEALAALGGAVPQPWDTRYPSDLNAFVDGLPEGISTLWLADGADHDGRSEMLTALSARGNVTVVPSSRLLRSLALVDEDQPALSISSISDAALPAVLALGPDPQGVYRQLSRLTPPTPQILPDGSSRATVPIDLPPELRNRVTRFALEGEASAGAVVLADDRVRRRKVALVGDARATEGQVLLSPLHYVREALAPSADLIEGGLGDVLPAAPDVVVMVDALAGAHTEELLDWVEDGGLLIRFVGPRMAALPELADDPLLPVRLLPGGRTSGGALTWGEPRHISPFAPDSLFAGLTIPADVTVSAQLLPRPDPDLPGKTVAQLEDGTPLVTRSDIGIGQVALFHTSANAEWNNLALSGLFISMLDRMVSMARVGASEPGGEAAHEATYWQPEVILDGFGRTTDPGALAPISSELFAEGTGPTAPAGIYVSADRRAALNAGGPLVRATWPGATVESGTATPGVALGGWMLAAALALLAADALGSAVVAGSRRNWRRARA